MKKTREAGCCGMSLRHNHQPFLFLVLMVLVEVLLCTLMLSSWQPTTNPISRTPRSRYMTVAFTQQRRLGNMIFDYAALIGIAHSYNFTPILPSDFPALDVFELPVKVVPDVSHWLHSPVRYREKAAAKYDSHLGAHLPPPPADVVLNGFFQSWRYFILVEKSLRKHLHFKPSIIVAADIFLQKHTKMANGVPYTRVGIHVRRGDILTAADIIQRGYITPDEHYYKKAIDYFRTKYRNVQFIVCTDATDWVSSHLAIDNLIISPGGSPGVDLAILSLCDHVIISVGTFGWWGAWLANGTTIYYDDWPLKGSYLARQLKPEDYFPPHWLPMH